MSQNYDFASAGWAAGAPATGVEQLFGLDAGGNLAAMPLKALRRDGLFNFSASKLPKWRLKVAGVLAGTGRAKLLELGDSTSAGVGSRGANGSYTNCRAGSRPRQLASLLTSLGLPATEYSSIADSNGAAYSITLPTIDPRITTTGRMMGANKASNTNIGANVTSVGGNTMVSNQIGDTMTFTPQGPVDTFVLYTVNNSGLGSYTTTVDGGSASSAISTASGSGLVASTISVGSPGTHKLTLTIASGQVFFAGVYAYNSTVPGIDILNGGYGGESSNGAVVTTNPWDALNGLGVYAPDLTIVNLGINDWVNYGSGTTPIATFSSNIQSVITKAKLSGDVILAVPVPTSTTPGSYTAPQAGQQALQQTLYALALSNDIPLFDMTYRFGGAYNANFNSGDGLHPNAAGYSDTTRMLASALLAC